LERRLGNIDQARAHYDAALPLYRAERARLGEAYTYQSLGSLFSSQEDWQQAKAFHEQALTLHIAERDPLGQAGTLYDLGRARFELGEREQGMQDVQRAVELFLFVRDETWAGYAKQRLAEMRKHMEED
jgi:tetratricopeptide (TPR) repeat protein